MTEALEALSKAATQGLLIVPERDAHTDRTSAHISRNELSVFIACAGKALEQREADTLFLASLWNAYRTGQLIHAVPSRPAPCMGMAQNCPWVEGQKEKCSCEQPSEDEVEAVVRTVFPILWKQECYNGITLADVDDCRKGGKWDMGGRVERYEKQAETIAAAAINALDAVRGKT